MRLTMIRKIMTLTALAAISGQALATDVLNHKSPYCGCCTEWTEHMRDAGFDVTEKLHDDMNPIKQKLGVTPELASCHTAEIDGYVFEGHIPANDVKGKHSVSVGITQWSGFRVSLQGEVLKQNQ